jgi:hypothetical protein
MTAITGCYDCVLCTELQWICCCVDESRSKNWIKVVGIWIRIALDFNFGSVSISEFEGHATIP